MINDAEYQKILAVKRKIEKKLLTQPGVHGVSIGLKQTGGKTTDRIAIIVHVTKKQPTDKIPKDELIPAQVQGIPTDVIEHDQPEPHADKKRYRPLVGGCQISIPKGGGKVTIGTLGGFGLIEIGLPGMKVKVPVAVTNEHVLGDSHSEYWQPTHEKHNDVGKQFKSVLSPNVDGAIGSINDTEWEPRILECGLVTGTHTVTYSDIAGSGYPVEKYGRTTYKTSGHVTRINYSGTRSDDWHFQDQLFIDSNFGDSGDSGSFVVHPGPKITIFGLKIPTCKVVGLYWGGSSTHGCASPIDAVTSELGIEIAVFPLSADHELLAVKDNNELYRKTRKELQETQQGRKLLRLITSNKKQLDELINNNKRITAIWRRNQGHILINKLLNNIQMRNAPMPARISDKQTISLLKNIKNSLKKYGDSKLQSDLDKIEPYVLRCIGKNWEEILRELKKPVEKI